MVFLVVSIIGAVIFAILVPLIVMLYIDIATITAQTKAERRVVKDEVVKMHRLREEIEAERQKGKE